MNFLEATALVPKILMLQRRVSEHGGMEAFGILECNVAPSNGGVDPVRIELLVHRTLRLGSVVGLLNTCLSRSVVTCRLLRELGVDARVAFGLNRGESTLQGHCWVLWPGGPSPDQNTFSLTELYPNPDKFPGWIPE